MPRQPRIDAPGLLYHVIARGIERKSVFRDDTDRKFFLDRLGSLLIKTGTPIYSFALIPNHFHLLLRREKAPISTLMQRLLTGYAMYFNKRHKRAGHLFQNRYKSTICQEDIYFMALVRYINLNPVKAGVVKTLEDLSRFRYASHSYILGKRKTDWFQPAAVLAIFGAKERAAKVAYLNHVVTDQGKDNEQDLDGGGLLRTLGFPDRHPGQKQAHDERVLGIGDFVERLQGLSREEELCKPQSTTEEVLASVSAKYGIPEGRITGRTKERSVVEARRVLAYRLSVEVGMSGADIARMLSLNCSTVSKMIRIGSSID